MGLPFSKNQARKLGQRLRASATPEYNDLELLHELLASYDAALSAATEIVRGELGIDVSLRLKNTGTIVEKLRRNPSSHLANIRDIAGMRIVLPTGDRSEQDRVCNVLVSSFTAQGDTPIVIDRREIPVQGYRAVHVEVHVDELPVEIQIRTSLQHEWAEFFEKMGDYFGREIRYGEPVDVQRLVGRFNPPVDEIARFEAPFVYLIERMTTLAMNVANVIDEYEKHPFFAQHPEKGQALGASILNLLAAMDDSFVKFIEKLPP